ncbi:MAG: L-2-amino-thiazoline-4-carboxylic acid hydrolase [Desulforhopalus sp.]
MSCCKDKGNEAVVGAMKMRARMYYHIFCEIRQELGEERATALMKKGIVKGGSDAAINFTKFAPGDLKGLKEAFLSSIPDNGSMFSPEVVKCDDEDLVIQFHSCPLKEVYEEMGLDDGEKEKILAIAAAIDGGLFGGAGFEFSSTTWKPGQSGCCRLHIKPGK